ncbi:MAG: iron-containing alcohol dehydrogenase [Clostridia bacterium]|nr:iron-containing alcohol dehydrogenase [Clostridia bacterium]
MNLTSYMPVRIISGTDCVKNNSDVFKSLGKKCLIVTGGSSAKKSGALSDVTSALDKCNIEYSVFDEITENPYTEDCRRAGECARNCGAEFIIGIGGGSPLDASKAVAIFATNAEMKHSDIYNMNYKNEPLPIVLVGTTSGTGSEVTGVSVLTNSDNGMKKSIGGVYARVSFCDYRYTCTMPYAVTVSTALDAFAHACESYFSSMSTDLSEIYAEKAFSLLAEGLEYLYSSKDIPDDRIREILNDASIYAGLCLNITGACFPHTVGYALTEDYGIPHGKACAAFIPDFIKICAENKPEKSQRMFDIMHTDKYSLCRMITELADINITVSAAQLEKYRTRWVDPVKNFSRTPGNFTSDTAVKLFEKFI